MSNFNLMILAAGYGKRMQNLTNNTPKPLLKINNKELLAYNIDFFLTLGCKKIVINTHYLHKKIKTFIEEHYSNINVELIYEPVLLDTGGGIKNALSLLGDENFLATNSDIIWNESNKKDLLNFIKKYQEVTTCKLLLVKNNNFRGLNKATGDFKLSDTMIKRWKKNDPHIYFTGLQIINPNIFNLVQQKNFSMNKLWGILIEKNSLQGKILNSEITHIGDINAFNQFKSH